MSGAAFVVNIIIAIGLAMNAGKHFKNPILWGIAGIVFGVMALGVYLIKIGNKVLGWVLLVPSVLINLFVLIGYLFLSAFVGF